MLTADDPLAVGGVFVVPLADFLVAGIVRGG